MFADTQSLMLGALPEPGGNFSVLKIILFALAFFVWVQNAAWASNDLRKKLLLTRSVWNWAIFLTGLLCLVVWLLVPIFWVSLIVYLVIYVPTIIGYVVFRNKRVPPSQTVLTAAHIQRLTAGTRVSEDEASHARDRVRLRDKDGKTPPWPTDADQNRGYQAAQDLLFDAIWRRASDVQLDMLVNQPASVVYKVDGVDAMRDPIDAELAPSVFHHLKRVACMNTEEHRRPQQGEFTGSIGAGETSTRNVTIDMKTSGNTKGERIVMKLFSDETKFKVADLGMTQTQIGKFEEMVKENRGVVIVSGPRGSGVTSTLYAIIRGHDAFMQNIHTLEVSKALDLENVTQHVYDSQNGTVSYGKRLRSIIRTEPDVVMVGETPDTETAELTAHAGRQGKRMYLGLQASDVFSALNKYLQAVNDAPTAAGSLMCVTNQRLARVVCSACRRAYRPDPNLLKKANLPTDQNRPFYRPPNPEEIPVDKHGNPEICAICQGTGYVGRTGVFEILMLDDELRSLIAKGTPLQSIKTEARKRGMLNLQEVALHKVFEGHTSINEVLRVTKDASAGGAARKSA
ncbi:MAG: Flp pilus assembly complex ATPase component TadA [Phycisphaerales bacterium]|nr:Flp pilus assembly complex ATPase component TadA [Phycisphaerales bacterium]MCB9855446.1 Flp pilus assembly complex ATPase component TadA [Phycisphaerales bacterium]